MKKLLLFTLSLICGLYASAQDPHLQSYGDMVEQNRAAVEDARRTYQEKSESGSQRIEELEVSKRAHEAELAEVQEDLKFAKEKEKNLSNSLKLNQKKLTLQRKVGTDHHSAELTLREVQRLRGEVKIAKSEVKQISQVVTSKKRVVAADRKAISEVKKSVSAAKREVRQQEKYLKQSQKLQQKAHQSAGQ